MKDKVGIYYYPNPDNKRVRMYVREKSGEVEFRMKNEDDPSIWNDHGWVPYSAIQQAQVLYANRGRFDPHKAYDIRIAQVLIRDGGQGRRHGIEGPCRNSGFSPAGLADE